VLAVSQYNVFTEEHIATLTGQLRSRRGRARAVGELASADFEQFERPPRVALLLAALNAPVLRDRARDSLVRALWGLDDADLERLGEKERSALRNSLTLAIPHLHADYLVAAVKILRRLNDTEAIHDLEQLIEHLKVSSDQALSWEEYTAENRVRTAANVACKRLKLLAEQMVPTATLLRPAPAPGQEELLRPASSGRSNPDELLRPE
jgi:hypothetical protein